MKEYFPPNSLKPFTYTVCLYATQNKLIRHHLALTFLTQYIIALLKCLCVKCVSVPLESKRQMFPHDLSNQKTLVCPNKGHVWQLGTVQAESLIFTSCVSQFA